MALTQYDGSHRPSCVRACAVFVTAAKRLVLDAPAPAKFSLGEAEPGAEEAGWEAKDPEHPAAWSDLFTK